MERSARTLSALVVLVLLLGAVGGCAPAPTPVVVEKEKVVEKPVVQTVVVEKEKVVEKPVIQTVIVEKEKPVEKMVTPTPAPVEKVKLVWLSYGAAIHEERYKSYVEEFQKKHPEYDIQVIITPYGEYTQKLLTMIAGGTPPDIFQAVSLDFKTLVKKDIMLDITDRVNASKLIPKDQYLPGLWDGVSYEGRIYAVPYDPNPRFYIVNKDLLEKAGLPMPATDWDYKDFREYAIKMTDLENKIYGTEKASITPAHSMHFAWTYNWSGHFWFAEDGKTCIVNDAGSVAMHKFYHDLVFKDKVAPSAEAPLPATSANEWFHAFYGNVGLYGYFASTPIRVAQIFKDEPEKIPHMGFAVIPAGPKANLSSGGGSSGWALTKTGKNIDKAWVFLEWLGSEEGLKLGDRLGDIPRLNSYDSWASYYRDGGLGLYSEQDILEWTNFVLNVAPQRQFLIDWFAGYPEARKLFREQLDLMFADPNADIQALLDAAAKNITEAMQEIE